MPNITPTTAMSIPTELDNLSLYKFHPNGLLNYSLNRVSDMYNGKIEIVDPSNPFMYLLETTCLNTAFAIQEYLIQTRKLYPRLANSEKDLYLHMSDYDYLGRFAQPAYDDIMFNILFNDFKSKSYYDPIQKDYTLKIPRHLKVSVDKYIFTLMSAVIIRLTDNGVIDVKFENQDFNNIFPVGTNYINFNMLKMGQEETYINFTLKLPEIDIEATEIAVERSKLFKDIINFNPDRKFYYFRAFYFYNEKWVEMIVTHTDQVYDINTPTCVIHVLNSTSELQYYIPPVYVVNDRIGTKVKFLVYTTLGAINVNFSDYRYDDFTHEYNNVFTDLELDKYTESIGLVTKIIYTANEVIAGKDAMSFDKLKSVVIDNSIGERKLPITHKQIEFYAEQNNFKLIANADVVTNRIFLLESSIPINNYRETVKKFNFDIIEYATTLSDLRLAKNNIEIVSDDVIIIPEGTVFNLTDSGLYLLSKIEYTTLAALSGVELTSAVNSNKYLSTYYHYVLDTSDNRTTLRAYDIRKPKVEQINFKEFNSTAALGINTTNADVTRSSQGFTITLVSNLKKYDDDIDETNVKPYILYIDNDNSVFYLEGRLYTVVDDTPVYKFELKSNYHINNSNRIFITNFKDNNDNYANISLSLSSKLIFIYVSNRIPDAYVASKLDDYIYGSHVAAGNCVVTAEEVTIKFGDYLDMLYARIHTSVGIAPYEKYTSDLALTYDCDVYDKNNKVIHYVGETVLDKDGNIVYKHRAGDVKLDNNGNALSIGKSELLRYLSLLFIDYKAVLVTKDTVVNYRNQLRDYLKEMIVDNASEVKKMLLENTEAFVVVPKNIGHVQVKASGKITYIDSMQKFRIGVYVNDRVYNDIDTREAIRNSCINILDDYLYNNTILTKTVLVNRLYEALRVFIESVSIDMFTILDEEYIEILDANARISLNKILLHTTEGYNIKEDVEISFTNTDSKA